jgi:murein DD-endopeptidase MepM/ murein hydrolase activator NlpD
LHVRGRLASWRSPGLAFLVAALAVALVGSGPVLAAGGTAQAPSDPLAPRAQEPGDSTGYRLPFEPGLEVPIHQGWLSSYSHNGKAAYAYDFGLVEGTPVLAAAGGVVSYAHDGEIACGGPELLRLTNYVTIDHPDGSATQYGHLAGVDVEVGDVVSAGQQIGRSGMTGFTGCMPHLHFARQAQGGAVTQSIPVYFDGYPDRPLINGETISAAPPPCAPTDAEAPLEGFCGTYLPRGGEAPAFFSRLDKSIDFDWARQAPGGYWLDDPADGFAARWSGQFTFAAAGIYSIRVLASDRVRLSIDGVTIVNYWTDHPKARDLSTTWHLDPGVHRVDIEHEDADGRGTLLIDWTYRGLAEQDARWSRSGPLI